MFLVDKLVKPLSNRISFSDLTGSFSESIKGLYQNVAAKDKIVTLCDHSTTNQVGANLLAQDVRVLSLSASSVIEGVPADTTISSQVTTGMITAVKTSGSDQITFSGYGGTISNIVLSDGTHYPLQEGGGETLYDVSGNGNHARISRTSTGALTAFWNSDSDAIASWNNDNGFTIAAELNGTVCGFDTGFSTNDLDRYEVKLMSRLDDDQSGNFTLIDGGGQVGGVQQNRPTLYCTDSNIGAAHVEKGKRVVIYKGHTGGFVHLQTYKTGGSGLVGTYFWDWTDPANPTGGLDGISYDYPEAIQPHDVNIFIGNRYSNNPTDRFANGHFYYFKGYKDGVLKCHVVPTLDGRLKDIVNGNLLTGAHGGATPLPIIRIPMMNKKTTQVVTFDGTDDYIEANGGAYTIPDQETAEVTFTAVDAGGTRHTLWAQGDYAAVATHGGMSLVFDKANKRLNGRIGDGTGNYEQIFTPSNSIEFGDKITAKLIFNRTALTLRIEMSGDASHTAQKNISASKIPSTTYTNVIRVGRGSSGDFCSSHIHRAKCSRFDYDFSADIGTKVIQDGVEPPNDTDAVIVSGLNQEIWRKRVDDANGTIVSADYANNTFEATHPNTYVHNGNEASLKFVTTGSTTTTMTKAQLHAHSNGTNNLYVMKDGDHITRLVQYDTAYTLTAEEQEINNNFFS